MSLNVIFHQLFFGGFVMGLITAQMIKSMYDSINRRHRIKDHRIPYSQSVQREQEQKRQQHAKTIAFYPMGNREAYALKNGAEQWS